MKQWNPEAYKQENIPPEDFAEVDALIAAKRKAKPAQKPKANGEDKFLDGVQNDQVIVELECAANIKPEPILWLWENWLALGKLHILAGQPGEGKSTIALKIAAAVSSGGKLPDGINAKRGNVIIWSGEDDASDTLTPRLEAAGADMSSVHIVRGAKDGKGKRPFDPSRDVPALCEAIKAIGGAVLIIIDPIVMAVAKDSHKNAETRRELQPIVDLAAELKAALLGITHFTKGTERCAPIDRVTGSLAFGALARVVWVADQRQETRNVSDKDRARALAVFIARTKLESGKP
jgi:putative DNA primase/helicase